MLIKQNCFIKMFNSKCVIIYLVTWAMNTLRFENCYPGLSSTSLLHRTNLSYMYMYITFSYVDWGHCVCLTF